MKTYEAEKLQASEALANVSPGHAPAPVYLSTSTPAHSPYSNQGLESPRPGHGLSSQVQGHSSGKSRTILPDFIVGGYKVKSSITGKADDDALYTSHKYISEVAKTIALSVKMFTENVSGKGQSYEEWRLTFANAVGSCHFVNDFVMGDWLRGRLAQDVANEVERGLGLDVSRTPIYRHSSAKVLEAYLQTSVFADQFSDHHFNKAMQRPQNVDESPLVYARAMQKLAFPIFSSGAATEKYLCSQILEGFTQYWFTTLFIRYQGAKEIVYIFLDELVKDINFFL
jgi:hypothetical protein